MKQIRPLTLFRKQNPDIYNLCFNDLDGFSIDKSKKGKENAGYWKYCWIKFNLPDIDGNLNPFFFNSSNMSRNNLSTISEMGRLLLTGWYYNNQEWTLKICGYVYNSYMKKRDDFNDLDFAGVIKHIRENITLYYNDEQRLKLYIVQTFFKEELQPLLPEKPAELQRHEKVVSLMKEMEQSWTKNNKNGIKDRMWNLEAYAGYLSDLLKEHGIEHKGFPDFLKSEQVPMKIYNDNIKKAHQQYTESILNVDPTNLLT